MLVFSPKAGSKIVVVTDFLFLFAVVVVVGEDGNEGETEEIGWVLIGVACCCCCSRTGFSFGVEN